MLVNYLGFPFWDVLTFPVITGREMGELNEILVDRISPQDARALRASTASDSLKGIGLGHFAAFLSRAYPGERLPARPPARGRPADRHRLRFARDAEVLQDRIDITALKKRGFSMILDSEETHLVHSTDLIAALRRVVSEMGTSVAVQKSASFLPRVHMRTSEPKPH